MKYAAIFVSLFLVACATVDDRPAHIPVTNQEVGHGMPAWLDYCKRNKEVDVWCP